MHKTTIPFFLVLTVLGLVAYTSTTQKLITTYGNLTSTITIEPNLHISLYTTPKKNETLTEINWETVELGGTYTRICYLENDGNANATLSMTTQNWQPKDAQQFLTLTWNLEGTITKPCQIFFVAFTLSVSPNAEGITNFAFDIIISAIG